MKQCCDLNVFLECFFFSVLRGESWNAFKILRLHRRRPTFSTHQKKVNVIKKQPLDETLFEESRWDRGPDLKSHWLNANSLCHSRSVWPVTGWKPAAGSWRLRPPRRFRPQDGEPTGCLLVSTLTFSCLCPCDFWGERQSVWVRWKTRRVLFRFGRGHPGRPRSPVRLCVVATGGGEKNDSVTLPIITAKMVTLHLIFSQVAWSATSLHVIALLHSDVWSYAGSAKASRTTFSCVFANG